MCFIDNINDGIIVAVNGPRFKPSSNHFQTFHISCSNVTTERQAGLKVCANAKGPQPLRSVRYITMRNQSCENGSISDKF